MITDENARDWIWSSLSLLVPVRRVDEMPKGMMAAYQSSNYSINEFVMVPKDLDVVLEATLLAHEMAHVINKRLDPRRWDSYIGAICRWNYGNVAPERNDALLIYEEESIAEELGRKIITAASGSLVSDFDKRANANLREYKKRLGL